MSGPLRNGRRLGYPRGMVRAFVLALFLLGCGASGGSVRRSSTELFAPRTYLEEVAAGPTDLLRAPERSIEELQAARAASTGEARRSVLRDLARAHAALARASEGREARRHREAAEGFAEQAGARDERVALEMEFLLLWTAWANEVRGVAARAARFTRSHEDGGELLALVWMMRGELALEAGEWEEARSAFRFILGSLGHPLYAYALFRTGFAWHFSEDEPQSRQALEEAAALGCASTAPPTTSEIAVRAARLLGVGTRPDGARTVPASCAVTPPDEGERRAPD